MIVDELIARLSATGSPFTIVDGAAALSEVKERPPQTPAAYVYISNEASSANQRATGRVLQNMAIDIAVVIVTSNAAGSLHVSSDIESLKGFVRAQLVGFVPPSALDPLEHVLGQVVQIKDSMVWFEDVYATAALLEEQP